MNELFELAKRYRDQADACLDRAESAPTHTECLTHLASRRVWELAAAIADAAGEQKRVADREREAIQERQEFLS